jgi:hypothetical protein
VTFCPTGSVTLCTPWVELTAIVVVGTTSSERWGETILTWFGVE